MKWIIVAALSLIAFLLRTVLRLDSVFQGSFVNFQETDAWYHVRVVENLVHHFPWRINVDPYMGMGRAQGVATGPFYDWLLGGIAWIVGFGHHSEAMLHDVAAWYPAVLGALIVPIVFLLGQQIFGVRAGLFAAAVIATLPGHFLSVSSLGFTDHHVMESLLSAAFVLTLLRALEKPASNGRAVLAGLVLAAYLLTFVGGAFFVAIIVIWAVYDRIRSVWPREESAFAGRPFYVTFLLAAAIVAPSYKLLWMNYSIATLLGGVTIVFVLGRWGAYAKGRAIYFGGLALASVLTAALAFVFMPGLSGALRSVVPFFFPQYFGTTGAVQELQSLVLARGAFTLVPAWKQFAGAYVLSIVALFLLGEVAWKRAARGATLLFLWGSITFLLAMGQIRMTYYFAVAAALLSGYLVARVSESQIGAKARWAGAVALVLTVFVPNVAGAIETGQQLRGVSADWRQALEWMRQSTPEPLGDASAYYARYSDDFQAPPSAYSVMAWWDYGYWIEAIARRIPVTNPTQANASVAASFYLAQSEAEALPILEKMRSRYVVANSELPLLVDSGGNTIGAYPDLFVWDKTKNLNDYILVAIEPQGDGKGRFRLLYRPAYYRSMAARLFVTGVEGVAQPEGAAIAYLERGRILTRLQKFATEEEALAAERDCRAAGCMMVGDNPLVSCVRLERLEHLRPLFQSDTAVLGAGRTQRSAVQVYEVVSNH